MSEIEERERERGRVIDRRRYTIGRGI